MNVPSDPGFTPVTTISEPVQTTVRPAAAGSGALASDRQAPVLGAGRSDAELEPPTKPTPMRIPATATARPRARIAEFLILANLDIVSSSPERLFIAPRVCDTTLHASHGRKLEA